MCRSKNTRSGGSVSAVVNRRGAVGGLHDVVSHGGDDGPDDARDQRRIVDDEDHKLLLPGITGSR